MAWTDDRLDREFERIDRNFERVFDELRAMRTEMAAGQRQFVRMVWGVWALLIIQIATTIAVR
jgi:hypothetical protein